MPMIALLWLPFFFCLAACVFAFLKGGTAERLGAAMILGNLAISAVIETALPQSAVQLSQITLDGVTALSMLLLLLRYGSVWLGAIMLLYAAQFALHSFYLVTDRTRDMAHFVLNNLCFFGVTVALALGTLMSMRLRTNRQTARAPVQPAP
jgi:hypothetical protein